ncbi:hypothetical protein YC2023_102853 [Brassica napus]
MIVEGRRMKQRTRGGEESGFVVFYVGEVGRFMVWVVVLLITHTHTQLPSISGVYLYIYFCKCFLLLLIFN